jgi:CHAD domain-containing protein
MRKDCKRLRYLLEGVQNDNNSKNDNDNEIHKMIAELEDIQDLLGSIHDSDTMIAYLKRVRHPKEVKQTHPS